MAYKEETKQCTGCNGHKSLDKFPIDSRTKEGLRANCKECKNSGSKKYRKKNKLRLKEYHKSYYVENSGKIKDRTRDYKNRYQTNRLANDPVYKLRKYISNQLRTAYVGKVYSEKSRLYSITKLGHSELINHLHETFELNYGIPRDWIDLKEVQIDHIIPMSSAKDEDEVRKLNHYTNLQLLFKEDNQAKGESIDGLHGKE